MKNNVYDNLPTDTPMHVLKKQIKIIQSLPYFERLRIACSLSDFSYQQTMNMLKKKLKTDDEQVLKVAFIETVYKDDFSVEELNRIRVFFLEKD